MTLASLPAPVSRQTDGLKPLVAGALVLLLCSTGVVPAEATASSEALACRRRQPVALAVSPGGDHLFVANRSSGSLSVIDPRTKRVESEHVVGVGLSDLAILPGGRLLLAVDQAAGHLLLLECRGGEIEVIERQALGADPATVLVAPDGGSCVVASTWSRRLTFVGLATPVQRGRRTLAVSQTLDLPFSPRAMATAGAGSRLVVADAFGGKLAVIDAGRGIVESIRNLPAHNIRGLAVTPDGRTLVVAHQVLHRLAQSDFEGVHWGRLLTSHLRSLRMDAVLSAGSDEDLLRGGCSIDLGSSGRGAADPAALACDRPGVVAVALAGVGEVALGRSPSGYFRRHAAGRRPSAIALAPDATSVYVADSDGDSVSIVEAVSGKLAGEVRLGPRPDPDLVERGEQLFHDARLSHDGWMSCQSCHTDGHSNGLPADTLGDGSYGAPKQVPSLLGVGTTGPWAWTGAVGRLEDQVRKSIETTMRGHAPSDSQVEALTAYLRSLPPARPSSTAGLEAAVSRGREVFRDEDCARCHAPPLYTSPGKYDVGLVDESGTREFNPPSLRGVGRRDSLLHDGRAASLEAVFLTHRHPHEARWTPEEVADLVAFLRSL